MRVESTGSEQTGIRWRSVAAGLLSSGALAMMAVGLIWAASAPLVPVSDLRRNLMAVSAIDRGAVTAYDQLGVLSRSIQGDEGEWWVAQSPSAVASAHLFALFGDQAESVYRVGSVAAFLLAVLLLSRIVPRRDWLAGAWVVGAVMVSAGWISDISWLNGQGYTALGISLFLWAHHRGAHDSGAVLLGLLIAWRPWLLPLVAFDASGRQVWKRLWLGGMTGGAATVASSLVLGGVSEIARFALVATPANAEQFRSFAWNLSLTATATPAFAMVAYVAAISATITLAVRGKRHGASLLAIATVLGVSPMVWSHYWLPMALLWAVVLLEDRNWRPMVFGLGVLVVASSFFPTSTGNRLVYGLATAHLIWMAVVCSRQAGPSVAINSSEVGASALGEVL